jgi:hypothetical protein
MEVFGNNAEKKVTSMGPDEFNYELIEKLHLEVEFEDSSDDYHPGIAGYDAFRMALGMPPGPEHIRDLFKKFGDCYTADDVDNETAEQCNRLFSSYVAYSAMEEKDYLTDKMRKDRCCA